MRIIHHVFVLTVYALLGTSTTRAEEARATRDHAFMEGARRDLDVMRSTFAIVQRKAEEARAAKQLARENSLHDIATRIGDLTAVGARAFEDLRVAIASQEPVEIADALAQKIELIRRKVEAASRDADSATADGQASPTIVQQSDGFATASWNLTGSDSPAPPIGTPPCPITPTSSSRSVPNGRETMDPCR